MPKAVSPRRARDPEDAAVRELIARAEAHPLGCDFLRRGALDAVAATFGVHAFTVDRARELLQRERG